MHELSIAQSVIELIESEAARHAARRIRKVRLVVGEMSAVVPEALQFCFEVASEGTVAEGAGLEIEKRPLKARCKSCGREFAVQDYTFICPSCGGYHTETISGNELYVDCIEIDDVG